MGLWAQISAGVRLREHAVDEAEDPTTRACLPVVAEEVSPGYGTAELGLGLVGMGSALVDVVGHVGHGPPHGLDVGRRIFALQGLELDCRPTAKERMGMGGLLGEPRLEDAQGAGVRELAPLAEEVVVDIIQDPLAVRLRGRTIIDPISVILRVVEGQEPGAGRCRLR